MKNKENLIDGFKLFNWSGPISPYLLAGFCVLAPIAKHLHIRPHVWLTGPSGAGKTWLLQNIIFDVIDNIVNPKGNVSPSVLVDFLDQNEGQTVVIDESTAGNFIYNNIRAYVDLARCSHQNDGMVVRGTPSGKPKNLSLKSCFLFASDTSEFTWADSNRFSVLELLPNDKEALQKIPSGNSFLKNYCVGFPNHSEKMLDVIVYNIEVFTVAAKHKIGDRGYCNQLALIAGAYSLVSDEVADIDTARKFLNGCYKKSKARI